MLSLWKTAAVLQHHHPLSNEHTITVGPLEDDLSGKYHFDEEAGHIYITIADTVEPDDQAEVLIHEYAHALCFDYTGPGADFVWGICYAGLYRLIFGEH